MGAKKWRSFYRGGKKMDLVSIQMLFLPPGKNIFMRVKISKKGPSLM
jgi:hypothetical protein